MPEQVCKNIKQFSFVLYLKDAIRRYEVIRRLDYEAVLEPTWNLSAPASVDF